VQLDPIEPTLKATGTKRLKLKSDEPLSIIGFKSNLRRSTKGTVWVELMAGTRDLGWALFSDASDVGAYPRLRWSST
jgi:hypothetical protein